MKAEKLTVTIQIGSDYRTNREAVLSKDVIESIIAQYPNDAATKIISAISDQVEALLVSAVVEMTKPDSSPDDEDGAE